jgi:hypothetical protein
LNETKHAIATALAGANANATLASVSAIDNASSCK